MKKSTLLIIVLIAFAGIATAQKSKLIGSWLMVKTEVGGEVQNPYFITEFKDDGNFLVMGIEAGNWTYSEKNNSIVMKSELDKDFNGEGKIINLTENELVVDKAGMKMYYRKIDVAEITESNKNSGLIGMWEFKDVPYSEANTLVTFTEPDEFKIIQKEDGTTSNLSGTWIFDKQNSSLIMIGLRGEDTFHGKNKFVKINEENLELDNNGTVLKGIKKAQNSIKIERLTFIEGDFYNEDGEYKYEADKEKLPWKGWEEKKNSLIPVKQLVYNYAILINGTEAFENKILTADVRANVEYDELHIDYIFNGFDRYNIPEGNELYRNDEYTLPLYPLYDHVFRLAGQESITTPAGTFDCTLLETINSSNIAKKLWFINDMPGIYAKIIEDDPDDTFGHYYVYELQEIK